MAEVSSNNLNAHYTTQAKVELPARTVACPPQVIPVSHTFNDTDANKRFEVINRDIYERKENEKNTFAKRFWTVYLAVVAAILTGIGLKKIFK